MSVVLESRMLRSFLHHLVDGLVDEFEANAESITHRAPPPARAASAAPRIMLDEPLKKAPQPKAVPRPPHKYPDVSVGCRSSCGRLEIAVSLSAEITERLGLKAHGKAALDVHRGKLRVRRGPKTGRTLFPGGTSGRLWFATVADLLGVAEKHAAESCTFHYDIEGALLIEPPAWLKKAEQKAKADPPASCKKLAGKNPALRCSACEKPATVECGRCHKLLCDSCWDPHLRTHWHSAVTSRPPTGRAAAAGR